MADADRPKQPIRNAARAAAALDARLHLYRGRDARGARMARGHAPGAVASRLAALERRVEEALTHGSAGAGEVGADLARAVVDEALAAWAGAWRWAQSDAWGAGGMASVVADVTLYGLYHLWWRVETVGLERLPSRGAAIIVVNRAPTVVPYEPLVVAMALAGARPTGTVRPLVDARVLRAPALGSLLAAGGAARDSAEVMRRHVDRSGWVVAGPETDAVFAKTFGDRYRLARFGRAFARVAIATGTPVVPVAVIGSEEVHPVLGRFTAAARWLGLPTVPVTPTLVPLPTKWRLHIGEPIDVGDRYAATDAARPECAARLADQARERLQGLILEGLRRRRSIFLG
jgi:1-acyl-sn-glycerol-3-phosphate acyltransferase